MQRTKVSVLPGYPDFELKNISHMRELAMWDFIYVIDNIKVIIVTLENFCNSSSALQKFFYGNIV